MTRPNFNDIQSFDEFKQYYWYRDELKQICKEHGITPVSYTHLTLPTTSRV